jgi:hypothetical protein
MNPESKELFRLALLRVLDANQTRYGLSLVAMGHHLTQFSFGVANFKGDAAAFHAAIEEEIQYLADKGLAEEALKVISRENRAWRITRAGVAFVDSHP